MKKTGNAQARPYHHGDLSRALVDAARAILEAEGPGALSLRAVAREAGVSPAAPYHHFRDKTELLEAVAHQGWRALDAVIAECRATASGAREAIVEIGLAYAAFALRNPQLYRLMYETSRNRTDMPEHAKDDSSGYSQVRCALMDAGGENDPQDLQLATIAFWCAIHGLAEMASFKQFGALKAAMGGEENFLRGVLEHIHVFRRHLQPAT